MSMTLLEFHEVAEIFPLMEGREFEELKADIAEHGLIEPVWTYEGKIIDGRNRYRACAELDIDPEFQEWTGKGDPTDFVVSLNLHRRHLTESQRGMVAARVKERYESTAKKRQGWRNDLLANLPKGDPVHARDKAAELLNVSSRTVESASKVIQGGVPELAKEVDRGTIKVSAAAVVATLPKDIQAALVEEGPLSVRDAAKEIRETKRAIPSKDFVANGFRLTAAEEEDEHDEPSDQPSIAPPNRYDPATQPPLSSNALRQVLHDICMLMARVSRQGGVLKCSDALSCQPLASIDEQVTQAITTLQDWKTEIQKELRKRGAKR